MRIWIVAAAALVVAGCQAQEKGNQQGEVVSNAGSKQLPKPQTEQKSVQRPALSQASSPATKKIKYGPKTTKESYELGEGAKIVSGTVTRLMHFTNIKGYLQADKPPRKIKFSLEGTVKEGCRPHVVLAVYDPVKKSWVELDSFALKEKHEKSYSLPFQIAGGLVTFRVAYDQTDPAGRNVRPEVFVKSVELEF
jgi:hypothetical protein